jgi:hypothetical protein
MSPRLYKLFGATLVFCAALQADMVPVGFISFDVLTSGTSNSTGVDAFDIFNFTGDPNSGGFALPPDFPVVTPLTFTVSSLMLTGMPMISLGDIAPGQLSPPPDLQFPDGTSFSSAIFSATLNETNLTLSDGSTFTASPDLQAVILPSSGNSLVAGTDFAVISATSVVTTATPEPAYGGLVFLALMVLVVFRSPKASGIHARTR